MTTATTEGRRLKIEVDGIETPFYVEPLPARRGRILTDEFIKASLGQRTISGSEAIFVECLGAENYVRISGLYIDEFDPNDGLYVRSFGPDGEHRNPALYGTEAPPARPDESPEDAGYSRFAARDPLGDEDEIQGEAIRQEEGEALALAAFYWQTVVGMEAVSAFLEEGGGTNGSLKALALLQTRLGLSPTATSRSRGMESLIQERESSSRTPDTETSSGSVRLPAAMRGRAPKGTPTDPAKGQRRWGRR